MAESTDKRSSKIALILETVGRTLEIPPQFSEAEDKKLQPVFNIKAMISKLYALLVIHGISFSDDFVPSYLNVHADVSFWLDFLTEKEEAPLEEPKVEEPKEPIREG